MRSSRRGTSDLDQGQGSLTSKKLPTSTKTEAEEREIFLGKKALWRRYILDRSHYCLQKVCQIPVGFTSELLKRQQASKSQRWPLTFLSRIVLKAVVFSNKIIPI
jgi:hypothetical protein